jgi:hypothetical protein
MRIVLKSTTGESTLCHGATQGAVDKHVGPTGLRVSGPIQMQPATAMRAVAATPYNRGNKIVRVAFQVVRQCATAAAAEKFCFQYQRDVLRAGTLHIFAESSAGAYEIMQLANTVLEDVQAEQIGLTVLISYTLSGGALT